MQSQELDAKVYFFGTFLLCIVKYFNSSKVTKYIKQYRYCKIEHLWVMWWSSQHRSDRPKPFLVAPVRLWSAAHLPDSVLLTREVCCSTSTLREAMALTVSASSSDWPWAPLEPSDSECPLVWDKLWRQGQCLPSGADRETRMAQGSVHAGAFLHCWEHPLNVCGWPCFLLWISITLSSEAHAFGHGCSWGHWKLESHWGRQRG